MKSSLYICSQSLEVNNTRQIFPVTDDGLAAENGLTSPSQPKELPRDRFLLEDEPKQTPNDEGFSSFENELKACLK